MTENERPLAKYHYRIPEAHRSRGWRVQIIRISSGEDRGGVGPTLSAARLTNGSPGDVRYADSGFRESQKVAVDDAVQVLMHLEPLE